MVLCDENGVEDEDDGDITSKPSPADDMAYSSSNNGRPSKMIDAIPIEIENAGLFGVNELPLCI